jgi:hypothetical protein
MTLEGIDENVEGGFRSESAGLAKRKDALNPPVALLTDGALRPFSPKDGIAQHAFGMVVGGRDALFHEEKPEAIDLGMEPFGEPACGIASIDVFGDEGKEPGVEGPPLP